MPSASGYGSSSRPSSGSRGGYGGSGSGKRYGAPRQSKPTLSASDRKKLAYAKAHGWEKKGGGWHNPITGAYNYAAGTISGLPATAMAVESALENKVYDYAPGLERYAKRYQKHERPATTFSDILKSIEADYKYRYGKLFTGHPVAFLQRNSETGFIPTILDVGALASGIVGGATKTGIVNEANRTLRFESPSGRVLTRPVRGTELSVRLKRGADASLRKIVKNTNRKGEARAHLPTEWNRAAKLERKRTMTQAHGRDVVVGPYAQAAEKLDTSFPIFARGANKQMIARNLRAEFVTSKYVKMYAERLRAKAAELVASGDAKSIAYARTMEREAKAITNQKVLDWVDNPTPKMLRAEEHAKQTVVPYREALMEEKGAPLKQAKDNRPWQSLLLMHGAEFAPTEEGLLRYGIRREDWGKSAGWVKVGNYVRAADRENFGLVKNIEGDKALVHFYNRAEGTTADVTLNLDLLSPAPRHSEIPMELTAPPLGEEGLELWRGTTRPGETRQVRGAGYHDKIFATTDRRIAGSYAGGRLGQAGEIQRIVLRPDAKILTPDRIWPGATPREVVARAEREGFDAVVFPDQMWEGTVILNDRAILYRGERPTPTIEKMIEDIRAELPEGREPIYQPHEMGVPPVIRSGVTGAGGRAAQGPPTRQNLGHLFEAGLIAFHKDLLGRGTQRLLRWANYMDKHAALERGAVEIHGALPTGWEWVKQTRGERIPYTEQHLGEFNAMLDNIDVQGYDSLGADLTTLDAAEAAIGEGGGRLAVPKGYAKRVIGDFSKSDAVASRFFHDVTAVWRALVLNLRPAWLVNNIVGNTLLYSVQRSGKGGLRAYLEAVLETGMGPDTLLSKVLGKEFTARLSARELAEILPDQVVATFMGSQMPEGALIQHTIGHRYSPARWARNLDQNYEKALRKAIADSVLTRHPRVKAFYKAMPEQERSWMAAVKKAVEEDSMLPERVAGEINAALGDFTNMGSFERGIVRSLVPFYAWYKAITVVLLKMPLDSPYRTAALAKMGQIGQEYTDQWWASHGVDPTRLPTWLRSVVPMGNSAYRTTGVNPWLTTPQLIGGVMSPGGGQDLLSSLNPVMFAPLIGMVKAANPAPWEKRRPAYEAAALGALNFLRFLPEVRLLLPYDSKTARGKGGYTDELLSYLGYAKFKPDFEAIAKRYNGR